MSRRGLQRKATGVTLIELLVVIAIIVLLIGLLVPAINSARIAVLKGAIKSEVQTLANSVEQYKNQYGDYPPDGSSWPIMESHLRKAFPNILITELNLLNPAYYDTVQIGTVADIRNDNDTTLQSFLPSEPQFVNVMDRAEALVFFLGGFSNDKQRPFTGAGGPFIATGNSSQPYNYNGSRENALFPFKTSRLSLDNVSGATISTDETLFGELPCQPSGAGAPRNDLLPVYLCESNSWDDGAPYVYFDSRTYMVAKGAIVYNNFYQRSRVDGPSVYGAARPFLSDVTNTTVSPNAQRWANQGTYQILGPGLDGRYGGRIATAMASTPVLFSAPSGQQCTPTATGWVITGSGSNAYVLPEQASVGVRPGLDDSSNIVEARTFEDAVAAGESK